MRGTLIERLLGRFSYVRELEKGFDHLLDEIRERDARIAELTKRPGLEVILKAAALDLLVRMASREPGQYPKAFSLADTCLAVAGGKVLIDQLYPTEKAYASKNTQPKHDAGDDGTRGGGATIDRTLFYARGKK